MAKLRVALLMGGLTEEGYLSLRSADRIFESYDRDKYDFICMECTPDGHWTEYEINTNDRRVETYHSITTALQSVKPDLLFVLFHGDREGDGRLAGLFDTLGIPYTGNGFYTSFVGMNKYVSKMMFQQLGLQTPRYIQAEPDLHCNDLKALLKSVQEQVGFPCVSKPVASGSSIGIELIRDPNDFIDIIGPLLTNHGPTLVEEFIQGDEYSIGVMGRFDRDVEVLPIAQIKYPDIFFDKKCKYDDTYIVVVPTDIPAGLEAQLIHLGKMIHIGMRFEGLSRTDVIVRDGVCYVLETNTHPGLGGHSIFPSMLKARGITYSDLIDRLIGWGLERRETKRPDC